MEITSFLLPLAGLISGIILGYIARRNFFCTLSSLEQHWYAGNSNGIRTWALAALCAMVMTQTLVFSGIFEPSDSFYLTPQFGWISAIIGGLCFGFGMAMIGTCGYGALVRLGGGSLKSLMAVLVIGLTALSTQRGLLAYGREGINQNTQIDLSFAGDQSLTSIASTLVGTDISFVVIAMIAIISGIWIFKDKQFRQYRAGHVSAGIIGLVIASGWIITSLISDASFDPVQIESASFVAPISDTIMQFGVVTGIGPDYGVGMVLGTIAGSAIAAKQADDIRWEACDDARELSRHIIGAAMMGFGGVLALGCTIGQGVSAASLLAVSVPVTMTSIVIGSKMGLSYLLEGSLFSALKFR